MDIYQLRYFLAVVETQNFSRAAERVFVSQPTLSTGIKKLEDELGAPVFNREKRSITLTAAGNRLLPRARTIIYECNAAKMDAADHSATQRLQVGVHPLLPVRALARLLSDFRGSHSEVQIALKEGSTEQIERWLDEGRIDIAIGPATGSGDKYIFEKLLTTKCLLAMSHDHPLASRAVIPLNVLNRQDFIHRSHCITEAEVTRIFSRAGVNPHIVFRTQEDDKAISMVREGIGLCVIPDILYSNDFLLTPIDGVNVSRTIGLSWSEDKMTELVQEFRQFASSHGWKGRTGTPQGLSWAR
ncbi:MAG: LysR family transcriptional regulator [Sneathiella sp.]|nr:LysR family transcriptional regulator [Sneathiella sp.]